MHGGVFSFASANYRVFLADIAKVSLHCILPFNQTDTYVDSGSRTKTRRQMPSLKPKILAR
jgi:hypothetical protein